MPCSMGKLMDNGHCGTPRNSGIEYAGLECPQDVRCPQWDLEFEGCVRTELNCRKDPKSRYYDQGNIEVLDIIQAKLTPEQWEGYLLGNLIKYSCRANWKGDFSRDIEKINFYSGYLKGGE